MTKKNYTKQKLFRKEKFCRCVLHVAQKNTQECNRTREWGDKCYNPYSICAKTTRTTTGGKPCNYIFNNIPIEEVKAYIDLHYDAINRSLPAPFNEILNRDDEEAEELVRQLVMEWYDSKK